ncbi:MAG: hypothetical protein SV966_00030 [Actinomycetota bacterium]|nr:hypothetical protein [Actinomycetota bacterium]
MGLDLLDVRPLHAVAVELHLVTADGQTAEAVRQPQQAAQRFGGRYQPGQGIADADRPASVDRAGCGS